VKHYVFAFFGDMQRWMSDLMKPYIVQLLGQIIPCLIYYEKELDPSRVYFTLCNNATWCLGEISHRNHSQVKPYIPQIMEKFLAILSSQKVEPH